MNRDSFHLEPFIHGGYVFAKDEIEISVNHNVKPEWEKH